MNPPLWRLTIGVGVALAAIAWLSPAPDRVTDRDVYEATAAHGVVVDCADLHCFRVLVPWILGRLPGSSDTKWSLYSAIANTAAAVGVHQLALALGVRQPAATIAGALAAFGFGSLYTLHDPFTADPLMFALGPILTWLIVRERVATAGIVGSIGVLAKEFAAAPLYIGALWAFGGRRTVLGMRVLAAANTAFLVWLALQFTLMLRYNYGYGDNPSTHLLSGGYVRPRLAGQSALGAGAALFNVYGAVYVLAPVGFLLAPSRVRGLALSALPVALIFAYVQQPDRALWNVHFIALPLAAFVLMRAPAPLGWGVVTASLVANLRAGAQLMVLPDARVGHAIAVALAIGAVVFVVTRVQVREVTNPSAPNTSGAL